MNIAIFHANITIRENMEKNMKETFPEAVIYATDSYGKVSVFINSHAVDILLMEYSSEGRVIAFLLRRANYPIPFTAYVDEETVYQADPIIGVQVGSTNRFYRPEITGEKILKDYQYFKYSAGNQK